MTLSSGDSMAASPTWMFVADGTLVATLVAGAKDAGAEAATLFQKQTWGVDDGGLGLQQLLRSRPDHCSRWRSSPEQLLQEHV